MKYHFLSKKLHRNFNVQNLIVFCNFLLIILFLFQFYNSLLLLWLIQTNILHGSTTRLKQSLIRKTLARSHSSSNYVYFYHLRYITFFSKQITTFSLYRELFYCSFGFHSDHLRDLGFRIHEFSSSKSILIDGSLQIGAFKG